MSPEEPQSRPANGRPPYSRQRLSTDGVSGFSSRRPTPTGRVEPRPIFPQRPDPDALRRPESSPPTPPPPTAAPEPPIGTVASAPEPTLSPPEPAPVSEVPVAAPSRQFTPPIPARKRSRWLPIAGIILLVLLLSGGVFAWLHQRSAHNNPDNAFKDALQSLLSLKSIQVQSRGGVNTSNVSFDFTNPASPVVSSEASLVLKGANFQLKGYGSAKNTYFSYGKLPAAISADLANTIEGAWVQVRAKGIKPAGVEENLANVGDPRFQMFGPVVLGNYKPQARQQLMDFIMANKIYKYDSKSIQSSQLGDAKVLVYPVKVDVGFLKVANQSAATSAHFTPTDVQAAVDALEGLKQAKITLYIASKTHHLARLEIKRANQTTTLDYSRYDSAGLPAEPQTKLQWSDFAPVQAQIEAQTAAHKP